MLISVNLYRETHISAGDARCVEYRVEVWCNYTGAYVCVRAVSPVSHDDMVAVDPSHPSVY